MYFLFIKLNSFTIIYINNTKINKKKEYNK